MSSNLNDTIPAAPAGYTNGKWQTDGSGNDSVCVPSPFLTEADVVITSLIPGDVLVWNGTDWVNALPAFGPPALPAVSSFTWDNQGGSTATQTLADGPILMDIADNAGLDWRMLYTAVPGSTPYKLQAQIRGFIKTPPPVNSQTVGIFFSDGTKYIGIEVLSQLAGYQSVFRSLNSTTSINGTTNLSSQSLYSHLQPYTSPLWFQIRNDGTNLNFDLGVDGDNYINYATSGVGSFLTPTNFSFGGISTGAGQDMFLDLLQWNVYGNATL